jgi:hypothetical protein
MAIMSGLCLSEIELFFSVKTARRRVISIEGPSYSCVGSGVICILTLQMTPIAFGSCYEMMYKEITRSFRI